MNDRSPVPVASPLSSLGVEEERAPRDDAARRDEDDDEVLDKYDLGTLACTD